MSQETNIDQLFKQGLENREVPFDPSGWAEAEKMLNDQKKKRFFLYRFRYLLSALLLLVASGIAIAILGGDESSKDSVIQNTSDDYRDNKSIVMDAEKETSNSVVSNAPNADINSKSENAELSGTSIAGMTAGIHSPAKNQSAQRRSEADVESVTPENADHQDHSTAESKNATTPAAMGTVSVSSISPSTDREFSNTVKAESTVSPEYSNTSRNHAHSTSIVASTTLDESLVLMTSRWNLSTDVKEFALITPEPIQARRSTPEIKENEVFSGWKILGGIGLTQGENIPDASTSIGLGYFLGASYEFPVRNSLSGEIGLLLSRRNAHGAGLNTMQTNFGFGFETNEFIYQFNSHFFAEVPLMIHHRFGRKHKVGLGVSYNYLFLSSYELKTNNSTSFIPSNEVSENKIGGSNAFNQHDFNVLIGYEYNLHQKWVAGVRAQFGLINLTGTRHFENTHNANHQLRFYVGYKLLK